MQELSRLNFRDVGGIALAGGRRLRRGVLYRSEGPASFDERHHRELGDIAFRLVVDLRAAVEREAAPHIWLDGARLLEIDVEADLRNREAVGWHALARDPSEAGAKRAMQANYATMPAALRPHLRGLVAALAAGELPALVHCTAGKDRTGVLIALLLAVMGAAREAIEEDYLRSDVFGRSDRLTAPIEQAFAKAFGFTPSPETIRGITGVDRGFLDAAFAAIEREWGSIDAYLASAGIDAALIAALNARLTEQAVPAHPE